MNDPYSPRRSRLKERLAEENLDAILVLNPENRYYLSGFFADDGQCDESAGALIVGPSLQLIATDSRYEVQARTEAKGFQVVCYQEGLPSLLPEILNDFSVKRIAFESRRLTCLQLERIRAKLEAGSADIALVPTDGLVETLRLIKDEDEVQTICEALAIAESVFTPILQGLSAGKTEREIAWEMERAMRESGAEAMAFPPIVASGPRAALPHAVPSERSPGDGGPLLFDWGCRVKGYCSDISRTVHVGRPDEIYKKVFRTVLEAQRLAIEAIKPGISTQTVDGIARQYIADQGFRDCFGHGLGHGVGLATHEKPHLSPIRPAMLEEGMVTTVEPGIYRPDWGGVRLENMVVIEEKGARVLNKLPLELDF
jgi:Xaa-Pro aminopeptidase